LTLTDLDPVEYGLKSDTPTVWRELQIKNLQIDQPKRSVVAYITDEEGEVVVPEGIDFSRFKKTGTVFYNHDYAQPCGVCTSIQHADNGIIATTQFPERPEGYDGRWQPDEVFAMFASDPPIVKAFSIGFAYIQVRQPNQKDFKRYGTEDIRRIVSKSRILESRPATSPICVPVRRHRAKLLRASTAGRQVKKQSRYPRPSQSDLIKFLIKRIQP
jgi:hypothetical protein